MAKRLERWQHIEIGTKGVYLITRFPMTGTRRERLLRNRSDATLRDLEAYARGYAESAGINYREMEV